MSERYHNIFDYYRRSKHRDDTEKEEVLENNVTKALLNTLELCPRLGIKFIEWLNGKFEEQSRLDSPNITGIRILKNPTEEEIGKKTTKIMLGIKKYNGEPIKGKKGEDRRVDGTIVGENWLVAIESKLDGMDTVQFEDEKNMIDAKIGLVINWQDIHNFFDELDKEQCKPQENLFIEHFTAYLKAIGQLPFPGFEKRHFALFPKNKGQWQDKDRKEFKDLMTTLGGDLYHYKYDSEKELNWLYREPDTEVKGLRRKNDPPDSVELKYYLRERGEPIFIDIQITRNQDEGEPSLDVFACVEGEKALRSLSRRIDYYEDKLLRVFRNRKTKLDNYYIQLLNAKDWSSLLPRDEGYCLGHITKEQMKIIESKLLENVTKKGAEFFITKSFNEKEMTKPNVNKEEQLRMIAEAMITLYPFVQFATKHTRWKKIEWGLV